MSSGGSKPFLDAVKARRTIYTLSHESTIPDSKIQEIVTEAVKNVPSSFNSQSARLVLVLGDEHTKLWEAIEGVYKAFLPEDKFSHFKGRVDGFRGAYGTILFYEDIDTVNEFAGKFATYADKFPQWSEHTSAMHQFVCWTALEAEGLGCNLQHYNPPINSKLAELFKVPPTWDLKSQLVFGKPTAGPGEKTFKPIEERLKVFGAKN